MPPVKSLATVMKNKGVKTPPRPERPLWQGPSDDGPMGGITQGLLSRFICCRERFRLKVVEGLEPVSKFDHKSGYGNLWHVCEEVFAVAGDWQAALKKYAQSLGAKYRSPDDQASIT